MRNSHGHVGLNAAPPVSVSAVPVPMLQRRCACGGHTAGGHECSACAAKKSGLQRQSAAHAEASSVPAQVESVLRSPGHPIDPGPRAFMERRFGHDFSRVRLHSDAPAAESARGVSAHAYTVGDHIVFGAGQYVPSTPQGSRLLAHELTHVVQQGLGGTSGPHYAKAVSRPSDPSEVEAETVADRVMRGGPVEVSRPADAAVQGLSTGDAIGLGVGIAGSVGLIVAAAFGLFRTKRWSISQSNNDGPNYSSDVTITFNPDEETMNCNEIAFVQSLRFADIVNLKSVETIQNYVDRRTDAGWTLDRIEARRYGWYGYNNDGKPSGQVTPGRSPRPVHSATLRDTPSDVRPNSQFDFETCAICRSGADAQRIYGCYTWGFTVNHENHLTSLPNHELPGPSPEFSESVKQWNVQATGPADKRNAPVQQPLGPFK